MSDEKQKKKESRIGASPDGTPKDKDRSLATGIFWGGVLVAIAAKMRRG